LHARVGVQLADQCPGCGARRGGGCAGAGGANFYTIILTRRNFPHVFVRDSRIANASEMPMLKSQDALVTRKIASLEIQRAGGLAKVEEQAPWIGWKSEP
jgi:hypothetical protein